LLAKLVYNESRRAHPQAAKLKRWAAEGLGGSNLFKVKNDRQGGYSIFE
jgi:hypothetical protein